MIPLHKPSSRLLNLLEMITSYSFVKVETETMTKAIPRTRPNTMCAKKWGLRLFMV